MYTLNFFLTSILKIRNAGDSRSRRLNFLGLKPLPELGLDGEQANLLRPRVRQPDGVDLVPPLGALRGSVETKPRPVKNLIRDPFQESLPWSGLSALHHDKTPPNISSHEFHQIARIISQFLF